jgi:hypothetical protein
MHIKAGNLLFPPIQLLFLVVLQVPWYTIRLQVTGRGNSMPIVKITSKGQMIIPVEFLEKYGLSAPGKAMIRGGRSHGYFILSY